MAASDPIRFFTMHTLFHAVRPLAATLALPAALLFSSPAAWAQTNGPFSAESFEAPRYALGAMPGMSMWSGQDGWILFDSIRAGNPNFAAASVQTGRVRTGEQAVVWDAGQMAPGSFGELRRNALFNLTTGVIEVEFDFYLTSSSQHSASWGFYTQPAPHPQSAQFLWDIQADNEVCYLTTSNRVWTPSGHYVTRDAWHHARTVVDIFGNTTALYLDGALIATGVPTGVYANLAAHGFTQFTIANAGNDAMYIDNFLVRERVADHGLSVDLENLRAGQRSVMTFRLAGDQTLANHNYLLLGSMNGTTPGIPLGGTSVTLPLVPDAFLGITANAAISGQLPGFLGTLSANGTATATFDTQVRLPASMIGITVNFAWFTYYPTIAASEPVMVTVTQ
ncbi:MAG: hypothetical protein NXI31_02465 [bacterium]|nr:hypothetical protein [bacterium]